MSYQFLTVIVPVSIVETLRSLTASWSGGAGMFTTGLTSDGSTISHYISTGYMDGGLCAYLPYDQYSTVTDDEGNTSVVVTPNEGDLQALVDQVNMDNPEAGLTLAQAEALAAMCDVSTQEPKAALTRMGLSIYVTSDI